MTNKENNHSPSQQTSVDNREIGAIKEISDAGSNPVSDTFEKMDEKKMTNNKEVEATAPEGASIEELEKEIAEVMKEISKRELGFSMYYKLDKVKNKLREQAKADRERFLRLIDELLEEYGALVPLEKLKKQISEGRE